MSAAHPTRHRGRRPRRIVRLLRWRWWGISPPAVTTCPFCGALVAAHGTEQHELVHATTGRRL